jgi:periplasmic copper chaperone A
MLLHARTTTTFPSPAVRRRTRVARATALATATVAATLVGAGAASAHVHVIPDSTASGSYSQLTFRVPNESPTASTTKIVLTLPQNTPLSSVSTRPVPGWKAVVTDAKLPKPVSVSGTTLTTAPHVVTWTAGPGAAVQPKQYQEFAISAGPLPGPGQIVLPVTQTYSDGTVASWSEPMKAGLPEPEHPAPAFTITAATGSDDGPSASPSAASPSATSPSATSSAAAAPATAASGPVHAGTTSDPAARWLAGAALVVALLTAAGLLLGRRRTGAGRS